MNPNPVILFCLSLSHTTLFYSLTPFGAGAATSLITIGLVTLFTPTITFVNYLHAHSPSLTFSIVTHS